MSETSPNLSLPYLAPAQAQKHVTVNEALRRLDAVVQMSVVSDTLAAQPGAPVEGAAYILPPGKTGSAWGAMPNHAIAAWRDGAWEEIRPRTGWMAAVVDTATLLIFDGASWSQAAFRAHLGLGDAAVRAVGEAGAVVPLLNADATWSGVTTMMGRFRCGLGPTSAYPALGGHSGAFQISNPIDLSYGLILGVRSDTGAGWVQAQRFDGAQTVYPLVLQPNGGGVAVGGGFQPLTDGVDSVGGPGARFHTVFAQTGAINTSDAREKTALQPLSATVKRAARRIIAEIGVFQWRAAVDQKGEAGARLHVGVTAQAVRDAFLAEGEDPMRWALFCVDTDDRGQERLGLRTDQVLMLMIMALTSQD